MTDITFADLSKFGIEDDTIEHFALSDDERAEFRDTFIAHAMESPEELGEVIGLFITHAGIEAPEELTDEFVDQLADFIAHYGVLGMKWGRRKSRDGKYVNTPGRMAGNHPGHGGTIEVSGTVSKGQKPKVGMPANTPKGRGTITSVEKQKDGSHKVTVDVPDPDKVKDSSSVKMEEKPAKADAPKDKPSVSDLQKSNDELAALVRRLQLEQQYSQLTAKKPPVLITETKKIIGNAVKQQAQAYATQYMGIAVGAALKKMGVPNAAELAAAAKKAAEDSNKK